MHQQEELNYVVGAERRLQDLLGHEDVVPLLSGACQAGASAARLVDSDERVLWESEGKQMVSAATPITETAHCVMASLHLEGEPVGSIQLYGDVAEVTRLEALVTLLAATVDHLLFSHLKRMLTTEIHTQVVNQSYEDLLQSHQRLAESEQQYRDLSDNLEVLVQQRTAELKRAYAGLLQQEKMASLGQLAAGVAHEINNPLGFILSNLRSLESYFPRFRDMLDYYRSELNAAVSRTQLIEGATEKWSKLRIDVISQDLADIFDESIQGAERVKKIVEDLKGLSHIDALGEEQLDLNLEIERALRVLRHEFSDGIVVKRNFAETPGLFARGDQLSQVLLNLLKNALQSRRDGLEIVLSTGGDAKTVWFSIDDNGDGIEEEIRHRLFEPFFTTRDVGQGTGLGLTVVYDIVSRWGGTVRIEDSKTGGTQATVTLPLHKDIHGEVR